MNGRDIRELFGRISISYDRMSDLQSYGRHKVWKRHLADAVWEFGGGAVLDVCCGTGDISMLMGQLPNVTRVVGVDFSPEMLSIAQGRSSFAAGPDEHYIEPEFIEGDASELPFPNGSFDCAVISFGLKNAFSPPDIVREMMRALRPGGLFLCLDDFRPTGKFSLFAFAAHQKIVVPVMSGSMRDDYRWLGQSTKGFYNMDELDILLTQLGFRGVKHKGYAFGLTAIHRAIKPGALTEEEEDSGKNAAATEIRGEASDVDTPQEQDPPDKGLFLEGYSHEKAAPEFFL